MAPKTAFSSASVKLHGGFFIDSTTSNFQQRENSGNFMFSPQRSKCAIKNALQNKNKEIHINGTKHKLELP